MAFGLNKKTKEKKVKPSNIKEEVKQSNTQASTSNDGGTLLDRINKKQ